MTKADKIAPHVSKKIRASASGEVCTRCESNDRTTVLAHYTGLRQHQYGKGMGRKGSDVVAAYLCAKCHAYFDRPTERKSIEASEEFLHCVVLTFMRLVENGVLE